LGNEHLRTAITRSGLTLEEFADIVGVDVKTVQRWLAGRVPYAGNRARVAGALDTTERALWPDAVPVPTTTEAHKLTTAVTDDAIAGYGHATDPAAPDGATLLRAAVERIEIAIPSLASQPDLVELLRISDANGRQSRILIEDPDEQVEALLGLDGVEIRASPAGEDHILYRADDEMLLVLTPIGSASASPPIIHLRRQTDGGLFDRLADDFDDRWLEATPLTSREQLHAYLADTELEPRPEPEHSPAANPQPARAPARPPEAPTASPADAPRRWPRRPT
jgi:transcriptional regulator with XRE-family HTH domain